MTANLATGAHSAFPETKTYMTDWRRTAGAKKMRFCLHKDGDKVRVQVMRQNFLDKLANFFSKKEPVGKVIQEKTFSGISQEMFDRAQTKLNGLVQTRKNVHEILAILEKNLAPQQLSKVAQKVDQLEQTIGRPKSNGDLTAEEIEARQASLEILRAKLNAILEQIDSQEKDPQLAKFRQLGATVQNVKEAAHKAIAQLAVLKGDLRDINLAPSLQGLKMDCEQMASDVDSVRQIRTEEAFLTEKAHAFTAKLAAFSPRIQENWRARLADWEATAAQVNSIEHVKNRTKALDDMMDGLCLDCKQEISAIANDAKENFKQNIEIHLSTLSLTSHDSELSGKELLLHTCLLNRTKKWGQLQAEIAQQSNDLDALIAMQIKAQKMRQLDSVLTALLTYTIPKPAKSIGNFFYTHAYNALGSVWNFGRSMLGFAIPEDPLEKLEQIDQEVAQRLNLLIKEIGLSGRRLLNDSALAQDPNFDDLEGLFSKLIRQQPISYANLQKLIEDFLTRVNTWLKAQPSTFSAESLEEIKTAADSLHILFLAVELLIEGQIAPETEFLGQLIKKHENLKTLSPHPSIQMVAADKIRQLNNQTRWDIQAPLGYSKAIGEAWILSARACAELLDRLEELAPLQADYLTRLTECEQAITQLSGQDRKQAEELLKALQGFIDLTAQEGISKLDRSFIVKYCIRIDDALLELQEIINRDAEKRTLRESVQKEIDGFIATLEAHHVKIKEIETAFAQIVPSIQLASLHEILDQEAAKIKEWKEGGVLPHAYLSYIPLLPAKVTSAEVAMNMLSVEEMRRYLSTVKQVVEAEKYNLQYTSNIPQIYAAYQLYVKESTVILQIRVKELKDANQFFYAYELQKNLRQRQIETAKALKSLTRPKDILHTLKQGLANIGQLRRTYSPSLAKLSLLDQMRRLSNDLAKQAEVRKVFLKQVTDRIQTYKTKLNAELKKFESFPGIYPKAEGLVKGYIKEIEPYMTVFRPVGVLALNPLAPSTDLAHEELTISQLSSYESTVKGLVEKGESNVRFLRRSVERLQHAQEQLSAQRKLVESKARELNTLNQLLPEFKLKKLCREIDLEFKHYPEKVAHEIEMPRKWTHRWKNRLTYYPNALVNRVGEMVNTVTSVPEKILDLRHQIPGSDPLYIQIRNLNQKVGNWISRYAAALKQVEGYTRKPMSIEEQLAEYPPEEVDTELRRRHANKVAIALQACEDELEEYRSALLGPLSNFITPDSRFQRKCLDLVNRKLEAIQSFKQEFRSKGVTATLYRFLFLGMRSEPIDIAVLSPKQIKAHYQEVLKASTQFAAEIEAQVPINKFSRQVDVYTEALEKAKRTIEHLRFRGHHYYACVLEAEVQTIEAKKIAKCHNKVRSVADMARAGSELKTLAAEVMAAITRATRDDAIILSPGQQLGKLLRDPKLSTNDMKPLKDKALEALRVALIKEANLKAEKYNNKLNHMLGDLAKLCTEIGLHTSWLEDTRQKILEKRRELENYRNYGDGQIGFLGRQFKGQKRLEDLSNEQLAQQQPELTIEKMAVHGLSSIMATSGGPLLTQYRSYKEAIIAAEEYVDTLMRDKQIYQANVLAHQIKSAKRSYEKAGEQASPLASELSKHLQGLIGDVQKSLTAAKIHPTMGMQEQLRLLNADPDLKSDPAIKAQLYEHLTTDLRTDIQTQESKLSGLSESLVKLSRDIQFPTDWRKEIETELETSRTQLIDSANDIKILASPTHVSDHTLEELSQRKEEIVAIEATIRRIEETYSLSGYRGIIALTQAYTEVLAGANEYLANLQKDRQLSLAKEIDEKIKAASQRITKELSSWKTGEPLTAAIARLADGLETATMDLRKEIAEFKKMKPHTVAELLIAIDETTPEGLTNFLKLRAAWVEDIQKKAAQVNAMLAERKTALETMQKEIGELSNGRFLLPPAWLSSINSFIEYTKNAVDQISRGMDPDDMGSVAGVPPKNMDKNQIIAFDRVIKRYLEEKDFKGNANVHHLLATFESTSHLNTLILAFKGLQEVLKTIKPHITTNHVDAGKAERAVCLRELQEMQIDLILHAMQGMRSNLDTNDATRAIQNAHSLLTHGNTNFTYNVTPIAGAPSIPFDAWTHIKHIEEEAKRRTDGKVPLGLEENFHRVFYGDLVAELTKEIEAATKPEDLKRLGELHALPRNDDESVTEYKQRLKERVSALDPHPIEGLKYTERIKDGDNIKSEAKPIPRKGMLQNLFVGILHLREFALYWDERKRMAIQALPELRESLQRDKGELEVLKTMRASPSSLGGGATVNRLTIDKRA